MNSCALCLLQTALGPLLFRFHLRSARLFETQSMDARERRQSQELGPWEAGETGKNSSISRPRCGMSTDPEHNRVSDFQISTVRDLWRIHKIIKKSVRNDLEYWSEENQEILRSSLRTSHVATPAISHRHRYQNCDRQFESECNFFF